MYLIVFATVSVVEGMETLETDFQNSCQMCAAGQSFVWAVTKWLIVDEFGQAVAEDPHQEKPFGLGRLKAGFYENP